MRHARAVRRSTGRRLLFVALSLVCLAAAAPVLRDVYRSAPTALDAGPGWLLAIAALVALQFVAAWVVHRALLRTSSWGDIAVAQLSGNAASHLFPAGSAIGAGVEARLLTAAGYPITQTVAALGAASVVTATAGFVVLPLVVLVAAAAGAGVDRSIVVPMWVAVGVLVAVLTVLAVSVGRDRPWRILANAIGRANRTLRRDVDQDRLYDDLLTERHLVRDAFRRNGGRVAIAAVAKPTCDYAALYLASVAVGASVNPAAALGAFIVSNIAGLVPFTPGGVGFVEAGLAGVLTIAGASDTQAFETVALYRIVATWLPCAVGAAALLWARHRAGRTAPGAGLVSPQE